MTSSYCKPAAKTSFVKLIPDWNWILGSGAYLDDIEAELIKGSVAKTKNGTQIAKQTSSALQNIVASISKVTDLVADIAAASSEQAQGITQVTQALGQVDQAVQGNTATAEESAAAAQELSSQSGRTIKAYDHPFFAPVL